jgi:hypothetical protein
MLTSATAVAIPLQTTTIYVSLEGVMENAIDKKIHNTQGWKMKLLVNIRKSVQLSLVWHS